jgi:hypothetical protein
LRVGTGLYETNHFWFEQNQTQQLEQETAVAWNGFAQALNAYVQQNIGNITGSETVACATLQSDGYYGGSCTDPVGETLEGVIAAPYGFPQSWGVIAGSPPNPTILGKYGLGDPSNGNEQTLKWHAFLYQVATRLQGDNLVAAVYNGSTGTFRFPYGTANSVYADYSLTATPGTFGSSVNGIGPDGLMAFPQLHKEPGYWLWQAQMLDENNNASISFVNYGYSAVCPSNGTTPVSWNSSPWVSGQNNNGITATNFWWGFDNPTTQGISVSNESTSNPFSYRSQFVCIPAPQALVNVSASYNPFPTANNNLPTGIVNPSSPGQYWNGDNSQDNGQAVQAGATYFILLGSQTYTLVVYSGVVGAGMPGGSYQGRLLELAFYLGHQADATNVVPSLYGGAQFNNTGGFYAPPVVSVPTQSISLN